MMEYPRISVSMIVKNEEALLESCLNSVKGVFEIVIVDTGSQDKTVEIAQKYSDKVFYGEEYLWQDDFAHSRNQSLEKCTGDWILIIDADEELEEGGIEKLREAISKTEKKALRLKAKAKGGKSVHNSIRAFKTGEGIKWVGAIHNYLSTTDAEQVDIEIRYGYSPAHQLDPDRAFRILTKVVKENPDVVREKYYLAREYWYRKRYAEALEWYNTYLKTAWWAPEKADAYLTAARCLLFLDKKQESFGYALQAFGINPNFKESLIFIRQLTNNPAWDKFIELADNTNVLFNRT